MKKYSIILLIMLFSACSKELDRLDLMRPERQEGSIQCAKGEEIQLFVAIDMDYQIQPQMVLDFEFYKGDSLIQKGGVDPIASCVNQTDDADGSRKNISAYLKLEGSFLPQEDGIYTIKPTLVYNETADLKINKFELVFVR